MASLTAQATHAPCFSRLQLVQSGPTVPSASLKPCVHRQKHNDTLLFSSLLPEHSLESLLSGTEAASRKGRSKAGHRTAPRAFANADSVSSPSSSHPRLRRSLTPWKNSEGSASTNFQRRQPRRGSVVVSVLGGGGGSGGDSGKQLGKYLGWATWGLVIWSALTGQLNWFFEGLTAITVSTLLLMKNTFRSFAERAVTGSPASKGGLQKSLRTQIFCRFHRVSILGLSCKQLQTPSVY